MANVKKKARGNDASSNFSARGWIIVFLGMAMWFLAAGMVVEGNNLIIPAFSSAHDVSSSTLYLIGTIANLIGIPMMACTGVLEDKFGPRKVTVGCYAMACGAMVILGLANNIVVYTIGRIFFVVGVYCGNYIGLNGVITNWFPHKKDLILGYVTIGSNISTAFTLIFLNMTLIHVGLRGTFFVWGAFCGIVGLLALINFRDNPEEIGEYPDNDRSMTHEQVRQLFEEGERYKKSSPWTVKKILKTKQCYQIAIGYGVIIMITTGVLSTLVGTLTIKGMSQPMAIAAMTVCAVIGMPCSYLWGFLGVKTSTKKATIVLYMVVFATIVMMLIPGKWTLIPGIALIGCFIGAGNNLTPSIIATVFGRYDFAKAQTVILPIWNIVVAFGTTVVGVPQSLTGSYVAGYIVLAISAAIGFVMVVTLDDRCIGRDESAEKEKMLAQNKEVEVEAVQGAGAVISEQQ